MADRQQTPGGPGTEKAPARPVPLWTVATVVAGAALAAASATWTVATGVAWTLRQVALPDPGQSTSGAAYLALAILLLAGAAGTQLGRRRRYYRAVERAWAERDAAARPHIDAALADRRSRPARPERPRLRRWTRTAPPSE